MSALIYAFSSFVLLIGTVTLSLLRTTIHPLAIYAVLVGGLILFFWGIFSKKVRNTYGHLLAQPFIAASLALYGLITLETDSFIDWFFLIAWSGMLILDVVFVILVARRLDMSFQESISPDNYNERILP